MKQFGALLLFLFFGLLLIAPACAVMACGLPSIGFSLAMVAGWCLRPISQRIDLGLGILDRCRYCDGTGGRVMTNAECLAELKGHVAALHALLADAEPGLTTWCLATQPHFKAIVAWWKGEWASGKPQGGEQCK